MQSTIVEAMAACASSSFSTFLDSPLRSTLFFSTLSPFPLHPHVSIHSKLSFPGFLSISFSAIPRRTCMPPTALLGLSCSGKPKTHGCPPACSQKSHTVSDCNVS